MRRWKTEPTPARLRRQVYFERLYTLMGKAFPFFVGLRMVCLLEVAAFRRKHNKLNTIKEVDEFYGDLFAERGWAHDFLACQHSCDVTHHAVEIFGTVNEAYRWFDEFKAATGCGGKVDHKLMSYVDDLLTFIQREKIQEKPVDTQIQVFNTMTTV